uniref:Uncharacterized protein n=1 Tax=Caenorhabditis japonica TaxID=281687 RepID=A0A8R1IKD1_CAEJA
MSTRSKDESSGGASSGASDTSKADTSKDELEGSGGKGVRIRKRGAKRAKNATVCTAISYDMMKVYYFTSQSNLPRQSTYWIPRYLTYDAFYTYADRYGVDYILIHHKGQWIYRINFQQYYQSRQTFFKVFHLKTPPQNFMFEKFEFADENGLITRYMFVHPNGQRSYRYFYSLFSEVSGLETFCVHNKLINGTLMIMGGVIAAPEKGPAAALRATLGIKKQDTAELHTVLRILFYCATAYLTVFVVVQIIPPRKAAIWRDVRRADREIQRLAPVIENVMARVYVFMENEKKMARKKEKKSK